MDCDHTTHNVVQCVHNTQHTAQHTTHRAPPCARETLPPPVTAQISHKMENYCFTEHQMDQEKYYPSCHKSWVFNFKWVTLLPVNVRVPQLHLISNIKHPKKAFIGGETLLIKTLNKYLLELLLVSCGWHAGTHLVQSPEKVDLVKPPDQYP